MMRRPGVAGSIRVKRNAPRSTGRSLHASLRHAEQALHAIRGGEVDALVMRGPRGARVFTLEGADRGYRVLLEALSEGVAKLTRQGVIAYCNARFSAILSLPLERTIGSSIHGLLDPDDRTRFLSLLAEGATQRKEGEFNLQPPGTGNAVPVLLSVVPLADGETAAHCLVMTDLTDRHRQRDAIALERAAMHARLMLADRMASMGTVAAGVAHEINNPLAYVLASLELVAARVPELGIPANDDVAWLRDQLERASEGAERVRVIVRDLKAFSRADDQTVTDCDLARVLESAVALVSSQIRLRARLVQDYHELPRVRANEARLGQVFVNLLVNAVQAIPAGAAPDNEIAIEGRTDAGGSAVVEIRDTGCGIPPENLGHIFEPFFTTKAVGLGTGLGLALCHGIVSSFGGQITAEPVPAGGTVFRVVIPGAPSARSETAVAAAVPTEARGRMLVIDDEQDLCEVLRLSLAKVHDVVTTTDPHQALAWVAEGQRFDVILCDMTMPGMTGDDFYTSLAASHPQQARRVVLMSGGFARESGKSPLTLPWPVLEKPFPLARLKTLMREVMTIGPRPG